MRRHRVRPSIHHFNLLLRAVRDCGLGDAEFARELLEPGQLLRSDDGAKEAAVVESRADNTDSSVTTNTMDETRELRIGSTDLQSVGDGLPLRCHFYGIFIASSSAHDVEALMSNKFG